GLSFLVHEDFSKPLPGLDAFPEQDRPPVVLPFLAYHTMVGIGSLLMLLAIIGLLLRWRGTLFEKRWLMWGFVLAVLGPYAGYQAGWVAAEVGRQPFIVYPVQEVTWDGDTPKVTTSYAGLRTDVGLSSRKVVTSPQVLASIFMFGFIYLLLFVVWVYVLN